jgi:hypothetical protein
MSDAPAGGELEIRRTARVGQAACAPPGRVNRRAGAASRTRRVSVIDVILGYKKRNHGIECKMLAARGIPGMLWTVG